MHVPDLAEQAVSGFRRCFDADPVGVWSAPGRVNLIGEHTDYNGGFVLPMAIGRRTAVALRRRTDRQARVGSAAVGVVAARVLDDMPPGAVTGWSAYPLGTAWALQQAVGRDLGGFDAYFTSDVPVGAGLSSSAALECSLALGLADLWDLGVDRETLMQAAHRAENEVVGAPTGTLDQSASLFCEAGHALFLDCREDSREQVPLDLAAAGLCVLVIDTRVTHAHSEGGYAERRAACERAAGAFGVESLREITPQRLSSATVRLDDVAARRARHVVTENARVLRAVALLRRAGPRAIGDLLTASHVSLRDDFEVSVPELDTAVDAAVAADALGARMTGGGFGGSAIALVDAGRVDHVIAEVEAAFADRRFARPSTFVVEPGAGARRERPNVRHTNEKEPACLT
ncbi:MAG: galactokinase [Nocardioidaceae bacterium]|nr:galactokinase [Nocardioidaceae bacterium]